MSKALFENGFKPSLGEEIANSISHGIGALVALVGGPILISAAAHNGDFAALVGTIIFVCTAFILYLTSTLYHSLAINRAKSVFQILDHSAIFLLIAGTYTPFALGILKGSLGWALFATVWGLACIGVVLKALRKVRYPWVSTSLYVGMGWLGVFVAKPLFATVPTISLLWLAIGGICYTGGVVFFIYDERIRYYHFVWHIFVLAGTIAHFISIFYAFKDPAGV